MNKKQTAFDKNSTRQLTDSQTAIDHKLLAFDKTNYLLIGIGMAVVILGFILMAGGESTDTHFDPSIFSTLHIKVAPVVCFFGFVSIIYAIIRKPKDKVSGQNDEPAENKN